MQHISFSESGTFDTAILIRTTGLKAQPIREHYLDVLESLGMDVSKCVAFSLTYDKKKPSAAHRKEYLNTLLPAIQQLGIKDILCCDAEYFKTISKKKSAEPHLGYVHPVAIKDYEHMNVAYGVNHQQYFYNPDVKKKCKLSLNAMAQHKEGNYVALGSNVLQNVSYPESLQEIKDALASLHQYDSITSDIEAFSLKHYDAGIGTISFAKDQHSGFAFLVDYVPCDPYEVDIWDKKDKKFKTKVAYGKQVLNPEVRALLREFLETYKGNIKWHNISYDAYVLIYQLWMDELLDQEGLLTGLEFMTKNWDCTKLITYLATNSCAGNKLSLKEQAHEYTGNYAQEEIKDIRLIPKKVLLEYNLVDTCATWFVFNKHYQTVIDDEQLNLYEEHFKNWIPDILQMQLTGMCLDMNMVHKADSDISKVRDQAVADMLSTAIVQNFTARMIDQEVIERNANYAVKVIDASEAKFKFNPNSGPQLQKLLYEDMELPVLDLTDTKQPATGGKTLKKLINHTENQEYKLVIQALMDFALADKVLSSFIRVFKESPLASDGYHYLYGNFNLGGTVSGRLSSSGPNLQNIPSGSAFAGPIKKCFTAPKGWLMVGLDYNSLEDYISALTTRDPMKLKVYEDGFCGHCLRASYYFADEMPDIDSTNVESVNSIKHKYPEIRQKSKAPTFLLTYGGTYVGLMSNLGFSETEAKAIEANYHNLYKVSDDWVQAKVNQASKDGHITAAFGLKVRTPLLNQVIMGNSKTPFEAEAEGRTAGNALGQSWGMLNSRASMEFMQVVRSSKYKNLIKPIAHIHDSQYFIIKDDFDILEFVNKHLVKAVQWQEAEEIKHPTVKLGGDLSIFYPTWKDEIEIKNGKTATEIKQRCIEVTNERMQKLQDN